VLVVNRSRVSDLALVAQVLKWRNGTLTADVSNGSVVTVKVNGS
jgi:hypothetical protein